MRNEKPDYGFTILDTHASADFVFEATGRTIPDLFKACALACFSAMTDLNLVESKLEQIIEINADELNDLLYGFISELIYIKDVQHVFLSEFEIEISSDSRNLRATLRGEPIEYDKHLIKTDVKAATYHDLDIARVSDGYKTKMILDL